MTRSSSLESFYFLGRKNQVDELNFSCDFDGFDCGDTVCFKGTTFWMDFKSKFVETKLILLEELENDPNVGVAQFRQRLF